MGAEVIRLGLAKPDDLRCHAGGQVLAVRARRPPLMASVVTLGTVGCRSSRRREPRAWDSSQVRVLGGCIRPVPGMRKKRESLKSCRPAGLYKDNWGPPGLAPELGIINKSPGSPPCPLVCLMLPGHGFTPPRENPLSCSFREPVLGLLTWFARCPPNAARSPAPSCGPSEGAHAVIV